MMNNPQWIIVLYEQKNGNVKFMQGCPSGVPIPSIQGA